MSRGSLTLATQSGFSAIGIPPRMLRSSLGLSWALQEWPSPLVGGIGERQLSNEPLLLASALALVSSLSPQLMPM
jgi:hypothetical protein